MPSEDHVQRDPRVTIVTLLPLRYDGSLAACDRRYAEPGGQGTFAPIQFFSGGPELNKARDRRRWQPWPPQTRRKKAAVRSAQFLRRRGGHAFALVALTGLATVGFLSAAGQAGIAESSRTVPLNCAAYGGDHRTTYDASVQPGIIVPDTAGWPYFPVTYTAYGWNEQADVTMIIGNINEVATTDHIVAAWMDSTDCFGNDDFSRNAWIADSTGHVFGESDLSGPSANNFGDASGLPLNKPIVGMTPTADGQGYWLVASDGGIFAYGDAQFYGSAGNIKLNQPVVGMSASRDGGGYTLVASDGGVFTYGDAQFFGSIPGVLAPGQSLNKPIEGIVTTPDGGGYWMVASDGGIFTFGDAPFLGSLGSKHLTSPIVGMIASGNGYTLVGEDGTRYPFGDTNTPTTTTSSTTTSTTS